MALTAQQKDARERIIVMAMMSGLTEKDFTAIGYQIKRQKERAIVEGLSARYHEVDIVKCEVGLIEAKHNGMTITAVQHEDKRNSRWSTDRDKFDITVLGPKGGEKYKRTHTLRDWEIDRWPKKLMVKRSSHATCLAAMILNDNIPTK